MKTSIRKEQGGIPKGGTTNQALEKTSGADFAVGWNDVGSGGNTIFGQTDYRLGNGVATQRAIVTFGDYLIVESALGTIQAYTYNSTGGLVVTNVAGDMISVSEDGTKLYTLEVSGSNLNPWTLDLREFDLTMTLLATYSHTTGSLAAYHNNTTAFFVKGSEMVCNFDALSVLGIGDPIYWNSYTFTGSTLTPSAITNLQYGTVGASSAQYCMARYSFSNAYIQTYSAGSGGASTQVTKYTYAANTFASIGSSTDYNSFLGGNTFSPGITDSNGGGFEIPDSTHVGYYLNSTITDAAIPRYYSQIRYYVYPF